MATMYANVWASGRLTVSLRPGGMCIAQGPEKALRNHFGVVCRHAYKRDVLLVPGIPEAANQVEGLKALRKFVAWASGATARTAYVIGGMKKPHARTVPSNVCYRPQIQWMVGDGKGAA